MSRLFATVCVLMVCGLPYALAQNADSSGADPRDFSAAENLRAARTRGPATWIQQARERHNGLISDRLTASRLGTRDTGADPSIGGQGSDTGSSGTGGLDLGGLLDLANQFGGIGNLGGLADSLPGLDGILNSFVGGEASAAPDVPNGEQADLRSQVRDDATTGGAIGRLPDKATGLREQAAGDEQPKFQIRLVDSLLQTFFTSITIAFQAQPFIDSLKDLLRPILAPEPPADDGANGDGTGNTPGNQGNLDDLNADDADDSSPPGGGGSIVRRDVLGPWHRLALV